MKECVFVFWNLKHPVTRQHLPPQTTRVCIIKQHLQCCWKQLKHRNAQRRKSTRAKRSHCVSAPNTLMSAAKATTRQGKELTAGGTHTFPSDGVMPGFIFCRRWDPCLTLVFRYYNCEVVTSRRAWESAERGAEARAFTAPSTEFVVMVTFVSHQGKLSLRVTVRIPPSSLTGDKCVLLVT